MANTEQLAELINKLKKDAGDEAIVINFADGNHMEKRGVHAVLADPEVLTTLKNADIEDIIVEGAPSDILQKLYTELKEKVADNSDYSIDDLVNEKKLDYLKIGASGSPLTSMLISSAKQDMELTFPDNASIKGSAGEISEQSMDVGVFLQGNTSMLSRKNPECIQPILLGLAEKVTPSELKHFGEEVASKRIGDNVAANEPVLEAVNEKTGDGKSAAVVYGFLHFIGYKDLDNGEMAMYKTTILIATDNDLASFSSFYKQAKELPYYRFDPETGKVSEFNINQVYNAELAKMQNSPSADPKAPKKLTDEQCKSLIPKDLRFKDYKPEEHLPAALFQITAEVPQTVNKTPATAISQHH